MKKKYKVFTDLLVLSVIFYIIIFEIFDYRATLLNKENKKVLIIIMDNLEVGDQKEKVENIFHQHKTKTLELVKINQREKFG